MKVVKSWRMEATYTSWKKNIASENRVSQKEIHPPTVDVLGLLLLVSGRVFFQPKQNDIAPLEVAPSKKIRWVSSSCRFLAWFQELSKETLDTWLNRLQPLHGKEPRSRDMMGWMGWMGWIQNQVFFLFFFGKGYVASFLCWLVGPAYFASLTATSIRWLREPQT